MQFPDFSELYRQLALSALVSVVRFPSLCPGIRTVLTSLMTGLKQSLWNRGRRIGEHETTCALSARFSVAAVARRVSSKLHHDEIPGAARNLREIVSPDLPNEWHRDFVNHS